MKPLLATDWEPSNLKFPLLAQPKIDGVRGLNKDSRLVARSLKEFSNLFTVGWYSRSMLNGFDGELYCGEETDFDLCRKTVSALNTIEGQPYVKWKCFDLWNLEDQFYIDRWEELKHRISWLHYNTDLDQFIELMPFEWVYDESDLFRVEEETLAKGYEGLILRDPFGKYKFGRSTKKDNLLWRIKRYTTEEAFVVDIIEGESNLNEANINELGYIERSTHQANMVPNGMIGALICKTLKDEEIIVSAGKLTHEERIYYFQNRSDIIGKLITYKHFAHGVKDKPRQPTFQNFRLEVDL